MLIKFIDADKRRPRLFIAITLAMGVLFCFVLGLLNYLRYGLFVGCVWFGISIAVIAVASIRAIHKGQKDSKAAFDRRVRPLLELKAELITAIASYRTPEELGFQCGPQVVLITNHQDAPKPHVHITVAAFDDEPDSDGSVFVTTREYTIPLVDDLGVIKDVTVGKVGPDMQPLVFLEGADNDTSTLDDEMHWTDTFADVDDLHEVISTVNALASDYVRLSTQDPE